MGISINIIANSPDEYDAWLNKLGLVRTAAVSGGVRSISITNPGQGYTSEPLHPPVGRPKPPEPEPEDDETEAAAAEHSSKVVSAETYRAVYQGERPPMPLSDRQRAAVGLGPAEGQPTVIQGDTTHDFPERPAPPPGHIESEFGGWRKFGEPSPGRKRRTKQEMAEDAAYHEALVQDDQPLPEDVYIDARGDVRAKYALSTGEERIDPTQAAEQAAIDAQDAEDEAAESTTAEGELTHDDLRHAIGDLTGIIGVAKAAKLTKEILGCGVAEVPATQEALAKALAAIRAATEAGGVAVPAAPPPVGDSQQPAATRAEVVKAITNYALRFDGTSDFARATYPAEDIGSVVQKVAGVRALSKVADTPEMNAKLLAAIAETLRTNPFDRVSR
jgi:hypothetical protein